MEGLPPLAPVPPPAVQKSIPREEWESCLDAWIMLLGIRIEASDADFRDSVCKDESTVAFLSSFYQHLATSSVPGLQTGPKARTLRKICFLLTRRLVMDTPASPPDVLEWNFLAAMCCCYPSSSALKRFLFDAWGRHQETINSSLERAKSSIIKQLMRSGSSDNSGVISDIRLLTILTSALPSCGQTLMAGSDFLDTLSDAYSSEKREDFRKVLVANVYVGLTSLLKGSQPNLSLLLDQLFSLKAAAGVGTSTTRKGPTILSDLICSTDLLARLERYLSVNPQKRGEDLVASLRAYQNESRAFHHRYQKPRKKTEKGKGRVSGLPAPEEIHVHRMSLVTQVQDLFPDLGSGYIVRLLDYYGDNPEAVVAHLLDASLSPELQELDQSEQLPVSHTTVPHDPFPPRPTPPEIPSPPEPVPARKNIFDEDVDLAELARSSDQAGHGQLRFGRTDHDLTADAILADRSQHAVNKAAIMSALATFDSDDDERDDTYDIADVGGTVDSVTAATDAEADADIRNRTRNPDEVDMTLFQAYRVNATLFARDSATRRSQPRASLKRDTGMTDEAIEGWAVMLTRDPKRLARLEDRFAMSAGGPGGALAQPDLPPTAYRKPGPRDDRESDSDVPTGRGGGGRGHGRGGRRGGRGGGGGGGRGHRGGAAAGASGDQNNPVARQKKEENKASRANHNRRQQRAKKMARGGGLPG